MKAKIICILDRSGSMQTIQDDAIGGFNTFLKDQQAIPGEAVLTLVLFDHEYLVAQESISIQEVKRLDTTSYVPRGNTAMYDAIGRAIVDAGAQLSIPGNEVDKVIVLILTDGQENGSCEYTSNQIAEMIKHQQDKYSWEFIFLAANQDAFSAGSKLNIRSANTANFAANAAGTQQAYAQMSNMTASYRKS